MPKYLIIDTETSGLFDFAKPADADGQPRLAELTGILFNTEAEDPDAISTIHHLVKPDGWSMNAEASAVNGLTDDILNERGQPVGDVLDIYCGLIEAGYIVVAHNAQYDTKVMRGELRRLGRPDLFERTPNICTMRAATPICAIPKATGKGIKFPNLGEAYQHFTGEAIPPWEGSKALRDTHACFVVFKFLLSAGALPEAKVHYAKNRPEAA